MKRYFLNKINKISNYLNKSYVKPRPMLLVNESEDDIITSAFIDNQVVKKVFKDKNKLNEYIKENNIDFIVYGVNLDLI